MGVTDSGAQFTHTAAHASAETPAPAVVVITGETHRQFTIQILLPGSHMVHIRDVCVLIPATVNIGPAEVYPLLPVIVGG